MCGGGGDGGASARARQQEQERQRQIAEANKRIERTFAPFEGKEWRFQPDQYQQALNQYEQERQQLQQQIEQQQSQWSPFGFGAPRPVNGIGFSPVHPMAGANSPGAYYGMSGNQPGTPQYKLNQMEKPGKGNYYGWDETGTNLYDQAQQQYLDYYLPQVNEQFEDARERQVYDLANRGLLASSARGEVEHDLQKDYNRQLDSIRGNASDFSNDIRSNVASAKQDLRAMAQSGATPGTVQQTATERARALQQTPALDPLGDLFGQIGMQQQNRQAASSEQYKPRELLFSNSGGRRNVRNVS